MQAALWGPPLVINIKTFYAGLKAGAIKINYYRKFPELKTAKDKFVNISNNVSIDRYCTVDLREGPVVVSVPVLHENAGTLYKSVTFFDEVVLIKFDLI